MTKKVMELIDNYNNNRRTGNSVKEVYRKPSARKISAENDILAEMREIGGYGYKVTGYNSSFFSCGYLYDGNDGKHLVYHTASHRYDVKM